MATQSKQIVKDNNLDHIIEVVHCKVEDITELPDGIEQVFDLDILFINQS